MGGTCITPSVLTATSTGSTNLISIGRTAILSEDGGHQTQDNEERKTSHDEAKVGFVEENRENGLLADL
jgi:hypothetical protein